MFRTSGYYFIGAFALALIAFWSSYLSRLPDGGIPAVVHLHAIVMVGWFALLIAQPFLIRADRRALHRALGRVSFVVAPLVVVFGILLAHRGLGALPDATVVDVAPYVYLPLSMTLLFAIAYGLAIAYRRDTPLHARFMICTCLALVDPVVARLQYFLIHPPWELRYNQAASFAVIASALGALIVIERRQRRGRSVFPLMLGISAVIFALWFTLAQTSAWLGFVRWFAQLPLPS